MGPSLESQKRRRILIFQTKWEIEFLVIFGIWEKGQTILLNTMPDCSITSNGFNHYNYSVERLLIEDEVTKLRVGVAVMLPAHSRNYMFCVTLYKYSEISRFMVRFSANHVVIFNF